MREEFQDKISNVPRLEIIEGETDFLFEALDVLWLGNIQYAPNEIEAADFTNAFIYACGAAQNLRVLDQIEQAMRGLQTQIKNSPDYSPEKREVALDKLGKCFGDAKMVKWNIYEQAIETNENLFTSP